MKNISELPKSSVPEEDDAEHAGSTAEVFDFVTKRKLTPREIENLKGHPLWPVTVDGAGKVQGLPEGISEKEVIVFKGSDGAWWAQSPTPELMDEKGLWRSDWKWFGDKEVRKEDT